MRSNGTTKAGAKARVKRQGLKGSSRKKGHSLMKAGAAVARSQRAREIKEQIEALLKELQEISKGRHAIDLRALGIGAEQAADLRARLKPIAEDWDRPGAAIYDED